MDIRFIIDSGTGKYVNIPLTSLPAVGDSINVYSHLIDEYMYYKVVHREFTVKFLKTADNKEIVENYATIYLEYEKGSGYIPGGHISE